MEQSRLNEVESLMRASKAVLEFDNFQDSARKIFDEACYLTEATSGYIALLSKDGKLNDVLFLESGGIKCTVDPSLPMPIRGLREECYQKQKAVYNNSFMSSRFAKLMPPGHMPLNNILFAPLIIKKKSVGVMGLANKKDPFNDHDAKLAEGFCEFAAMALVNSRNLDNIRENINKLEKSLKEIKTLKGFIPICSHCKNVRDDEGFWLQVEEYVSRNSDLLFSHSLCPKCLKEHYQIEE
ncbi:hypothetical protein NEF87_003695 [Candidatus Lokiarchaeum ossiferum]|uniref:GAF domain-containing protein n=1 Tax=Candidatus Lokiarchaeum ossiferum TaxID=2951803 RepID=A0ABY6HV54_9ARCH|nr:hypothetical protein NEF87_003695 [Candidatus Lokiarchaeum sp. B-35]